MLSKEEQKQFAALINSIVDIPLVPEDMEQQIFEHAVAVISSERICRQAGRINQQKV